MSLKLFVMHQLFTSFYYNISLLYVNEKYRNKLKVIFSHLNTLISKLVDSSIIYDSSIIKYGSQKKAVHFNDFHINFVTIFSSFY